MSATVATAEKSGAGLPWRSLAGLGVAAALLAVACLLPPVQGLPVAGQRAIGILLFAVVLWVTEAVDYTVSAMLIVCAIILLVGTAPALDNPANLVGIGRARDWAIAGFANNAVVLVGAALVFAAAVGTTGLDKRIALATLKLAGAETRAIFVATLAVGIVLAFLVPSATARVSAVVPIVLGIIAAFGIARDSRLAALLMIGSAQLCSVMNIGVLTAAAWRWARCWCRPRARAGWPARSCSSSRSTARRRLSSSR